MADAARYAAMSWPAENYHFRRVWAEPPPEKGRGLGAVGAAPQGLGNNSTTNSHSVSTRLAQRAFAWDRAADAELALGHHATAERLSRLAEGLREAAHD